MKTNKKSNNKTQTLERKKQEQKKMKKFLEDFRDLMNGKVEIYLRKIMHHSCNARQSVLLRM